MTTIQEVVLQIKDKNVKWENNVSNTSDNVSIKHK